MKPMDNVVGRAVTGKLGWKTLLAGAVLIGLGYYMKDGAMMAQGLAVIGIRDALAKGK